MKQYLSKIDSHVWLVLALSVFAWAPLLTPAYFFNAHDARHSVFFLVEFDLTWRDGYWWPRWSPDFAFGYGYPLFNLYAPLSFYAAELLVLAGLGFTTAIKSMYVLATVGGGLAMFGFVRRLFGRDAGLLAAVTYVYVPFHLVEIYVRSAYAEFVSLAVIPLVFWAYTGLVAAPSRRRLALAGLTYGVLALTHHTSFFTFTPFLMIYILFLLALGFRQGQGTSGAKLRSLLAPIGAAAAAGLLGVALAAIYLIPVITETRFIKVEQWTSGSYNYLAHFVYFSQFFSEKWGYGYAGPGPIDDFSYQLGLIVVSLLLFTVVFSWRTHYPHRATAFFFLIATLVAILLMSPLAESVWRVVPIASLVQFPWRLLALTAFTMAIAAGALITSVKPAPAAPGLSLLALVVILGSFPYTLPQYTDIPAWAETPLAVVNWDRASIVDRVGMVSVTDEQPQTSPMEPQYLAGEPLVTAGIIAGQGSLEMLHHGGASDGVRVQADEQVTLQFYTYDYPGWEVTLDGQLVPHRHEPPHGLITVEVPPGEHIVWLRMGTTPSRTLGMLGSWAAGLAILGLYFVPIQQRPRIDNS